MYVVFNSHGFFFILALRNESVEHTLGDGEMHLSDAIITGQVASSQAVRSTL
jgi:hypothetical protein